MKLFTKTAVLAVGVSMVSAAAQAAFTANDLYLGFNRNNAASDYLIDLGQASAVGVGGSSVVDLSSYVSLSLFTSIFTSNNLVNVGVVGGQSQFPSSYSIYVTTLRLGGAGTYGSPGSDLSGLNHSQQTIANSVSDLGQVAFPTAGNGVEDSGKSWSAHVTALAIGSFFGDSGADPTSTLDGSGIIYQDLWKATPGSAYTFQGYFTLDLNGPAATLTFTPVPEPRAVTLFGLAGLVWLFGFRNFKNKLA